MRACTSCTLLCVRVYFVSYSYMCFMCFMLRVYARVVVGACMCLYICVHVLLCVCHVCSPVYVRVCPRPLGGERDLLL